jgi:hypothetical protein
VDTQEVVQQVRSGVDDRIVCLKLCDQILPPLTIAAKGQQVLSFFTLLSLYATGSISSHRYVQLLHNWCQLHITVVLSVTKTQIDESVFREDLLALLFQSILETIHPEFGVNPLFFWKLMI